MQPITFLFLAFGDNLNNPIMANFSFLTLKKLAPKNSKIVIYTDRPESYKCSASFVEIRLLDQKTLEQWKGEHKFIWRIKIMAMLDSAQKDPGHLAYMDTDTIAFENLSPMIEKLEAGTCFMHLKENKLCEDLGANKKLMWKQTEGKIFGGMIVDQNSTMWNAGVVAINENEKIQLISIALTSTDEMCALGVERWLIEQLSLSQALSSTGKLEAADKWIAHYWGNKAEWIQNINNFFSKMFQEMRSVEEMTNLLDLKFWNALPIIRYQKSFNKKLKRFADKHFEDSTKKLF